MSQRKTRVYDPDLAEGALEFVERCYQTVPAYHGGWAHLHPSDQADFLAMFPSADEELEQLLVRHKAGYLEADQAARLSVILALQEAAMPLLRSLVVSQAEATRPEPAVPGVLDD